VITTWSSCHGLSPDVGNNASYRPKFHLSQLFRFPEPLLFDDEFNFDKYARLTPTDKNTDGGLLGIRF